MATPLNKHYPDGRPYFRPPPVEAAIDELLGQDFATACRRAAIPDRNSPEYVPSEALVHLIRDARRRNDEAAMNILLPILLRRCESNLRIKVSSDLPNAEDIREEILGQFSELFAADGVGSDPYQLDFFEAHFDQAFQRLRIDIVRHEGRRVLNRTYLPLPDENEDKSSVDESVLKYFQTAPDQESTFDLQRLIDALQMLPPDERRAVELCHILGYDEESADRNKRTAATICGVTGRTIRNRLRRAAARLSSYKELIQ